MKIAFYTIALCAFIFIGVVFYKFIQVQSSCKQFIDELSTLTQETPVDTFSITNEKGVQRVYQLISD